MKELKALYDELICDLRTEHDLWVKSNRKLNSISLAKKQIQTVGDVSCDPAMEILTEAQAKELHFNDGLTVKMYAHKDLIRKIELFANDRGEEWNGVYEVFGY